MWLFHCLRSICPLQRYQRHSPNECHTNEPTENIKQQNIHHILYCFSNEMMLGADGITFLWRAISSPLEFHTVDVLYR